MAAVIRVALQARDIGLSYCVSTGNEAALAAEDFLEEFIADPHTRVIAMLMEQVRQPQRFLDLAARAREVGKSIVLHHLGKSAAGKTAAQTHTGALSGDYAVMAAQVRSRGVYLVDSLELLIDVPELLIRFNNVRPLPGTVVVTESGAFKGMALDFCEAAGLWLPPLCSRSYDGLAKELPAFSPPSNPLDLTAQALVDPTLYQRVLSLVADDPAYGSIAIAITLPSAESADRKLPPIIAALEAFGGRKAVVFAMLGEDCPIPGAHIDAIRATGTPFFRSPERAFRALAALAAPIAAAPGPSVRIPVGPRLESGTVTEYEAKQLLARLGVRMPAGRFVVTLEEAIAAAGELGFPLALKAQAGTLPHKSDAGGVALGIRDLDALCLRWEKMHQDLAASRPDVTLEGVLVERMSEEGIELIVGARNEGGWGPVILVGLGGVLAELLKDSTLIPAGVGREEIHRALRALQGARLFDGYRGAPPADLDAVVDIIEALGTLLLQHPEIAEMDLNPVRVHPQGATVLDALMVVR
jgi:acyl-CoA synthetase (NDP forming)